MDGMDLSILVFCQNKNRGVYIKIIKIIFILKSKKLHKSSGSLAHSFSGFVWIQHSIGMPLSLVPFFRSAISISMQPFSNSIRVLYYLIFAFHSVSPLRLLYNWWSNFHPHLFHCMLICLKFWNQVWVILVQSVKSVVISKYSDSIKIGIMSNFFYL